ncbi:hypothetical protein JCM24511_04183 [Saitozyma sp. JCM 24511]|nr:hypothetical protein JCM24511_04183 [Saitozyma sp. JCM 24511]
MLLSLLLVIQVLAQSAFVVHAVPFQQPALPANPRLRQVTREEVVARAALRRRIPTAIRRAQASTATSTCTDCTTVDPVIVENFDITVDPIVEVVGSNDSVNVQVDPQIGINAANPIDVTIAFGNGVAYSAPSTGQSLSQQSGDTVSSKRAGGPSRSRSPPLLVDSSDDTAVSGTDDTGVESLGQTTWQDGSRSVSPDILSLE